MLPILKSTLKSTFIYSIGTFSSRLAGFILIPLYTSHFSTGEYGMLSIMEVTSQIFLSLLGFSLYNAFFRWYWDKNYTSKQKSIFFTILVFIAFQIILMLGVVFLIDDELSVFLFDSSQYGNLITLLLVVSAFESVGVMISTLLRIKEQAAFYTVLQVLKLAVSIVFTVYFIKYQNLGIEAIYIAQIFANTVYLLLILKILIKNVELKLEWKILWGMLVFSLPLVLTSISGIILNITDRYALRFISSMSEVGVYSLGYKVANTLRAFIITSVNLSIQPIIYKIMDQPGNKRFYSKIMTYFTFGLMFFVLFFALYSPEIIKIISKKNMEFWSAYKIVPILSFSMLFSMLRDVSFTGLNLTKKTKIIAVLIVTAAALNILLNILLIPRFGFYGAAIAATISQFLYFISVYKFSQKHYPIPYEISKITLMLIVGVILYILGSLITGWPLGWRLLFKGLMIGLFPFILYPFGFYEPIELTRLKEFWQKWRKPSD